MAEPDDKYETFHRFADIVQHYDDEARPAHDDIDFDPLTLDDLDAIELDAKGQPVVQYGIVIIEFINDSDFPEDPLYLDELDLSMGGYDDIIHDALRRACERPYGFQYKPRHYDSGESSEDE